MKKQFFREATIGEIKKKKFVDFKDLGKLHIVATLEHDEYTAVPNFVPEEYSYRKFMKHGPEVRIPRFFSLEQAVKQGRTPVQLREMAFNSLNGFEFCGYSFLPVLPTEADKEKDAELRIDERKRKIALVECLEGARLFAYSHQSGVGIKVKAYSDSKRVRIDGAEVICDVPSRSVRGKRTEGMRMQFKLLSVPVVDSREKYAIAYNIGSDHSCPAKRFNIRYRYTDDKESSGVVNICTHEIAAYLQVVQQELNDEKNIIPLQMCQFAIPSQETADYYLKWLNNVLIMKLDKKGEIKYHKPNRAHIEMGLWDFVGAKGHDETFYSMQSRDGNVRDYNWQVKK